MTQEEAIAWVQSHGYKPNPRSKKLWVKTKPGAGTGRLIEVQIRVTRVKISKKCRFADVIGAPWKQIYSRYLCRVYVTPEGKLALFKTTK